MVVLTAELVLEAEAVEVFVAEAALGTLAEIQTEVVVKLFAEELQLEKQELSGEFGEQV